jgi:16S rRNA processing protein RimM
MPPNRILLGRITGAHGIRGEVAVQSFAHRPEAIGDYGALTDERGTRTFDLKVLRVTPKGAVVARVRGIADRNAAEALIGTELYVERDRLPPPAGDEYYHADLIGLAAVAPDGRRIGEIVGIQNYGAGDLVEIRLAGSEATELIPFADAFVPEVDIPAGRIVVVMPASMDDSE